MKLYKTHIIGLLFGCILITGSTDLSAQNNPSHLNFGIGISAWGIPVYGSYDTPITEDINMGAGISFRSRTNRDTFGKFRHTIIGLGVSGHYFFDRILEIPSDYDLYGGLGLDYYIWNTTVKDRFDGFEEGYTGSGSGGVGLNLIVGGRYFFNEKWGLNLELGGGNVISGAKFGVSARL